MCVYTQFVRRRVPTKTTSPSVSTMTVSHNDLATLHRIVDEHLWGLIFVVRHAAPRISQGSITLTSGSLSSRPRPGTAMFDRRTVGRGSPGT
jgi:hypothetical protein